MLFFKGEAIDIIEYFDDQIIVQELLSKKILTIYWHELDFFDKIEQRPASNIVSLDWYRRYKEKKNTKGKK